MKVMVSDTAGGHLARRLIPSISLFLLGVGWVRLKGEELGLYDTRVGLSLMVVVVTIVTTIIIAA